MSSQNHPQASNRSATLQAAAMPQRAIYVVLAAYNEASNLSAVFKEIENAGKASRARFSAMLVNDGSSDSTMEVVRSYAGAVPLTVVEHAINLGLGAAIRSGLFKAMESAADHDVIVTMDADNTHTPADIARMVDKIDQGFDVVIASRYRKGAVVLGVPILRRFLSYAASRLFRLILPVGGVRDYTCGYRAYRASVLRQAMVRYRQEFIDQGGFQCMVDILLKLNSMGVRFAEEPLILRYDRKRGVSKMKVFRTAFKTLLLLFRRRLGY
jgi:dolichol-phosphate mannosyltransferase